MGGSRNKSLHPVPRGRVAFGTARTRHPLLAGIRAGGATLATFPKAWTFSGVCARAEGDDFSPISSAVPLRGQRSFGVAHLGVDSFCFPFNCAGVNTGTGTNERYSRGPCRRARQLEAPMAKIDELADRVERLLLRHAELQRTNTLLTEQLALVTHDRDSLRSRLSAARGRIDALLERLPADVVRAAADDKADGGAP